MKSPIIVALDYHQLDEALAMADALDPKQCRVKVGKELFTMAGPQAVQALQTRGFDVFLDLKFHDIPNTVAQAVHAAADLGVWMVNVHAMGGQKMMEAAANILQRHTLRTHLIAVTVLTSMSEPELNATGVTSSLRTHVDRLARLAQSAGLEGVVCSAQEAAQIKACCGERFLKVTPGIRPSFAAQDDQQRITTPTQALLQGSTHLVIGRPITQASNPLDALQRIQDEVESAPRAC